MVKSLTLLPVNGKIPVHSVSGRLAAFPSCFPYPQRANVFVISADPASGKRRLLACKQGRHPSGALLIFASESMVTVSMNCADAEMKLAREFIEWISTSTSFTAVDDFGNDWTTVIQRRRSAAAGSERRA